MGANEASVDRSPVDHAAVRLGVPARTPTGRASPSSGCAAAGASPSPPATPCGRPRCCDQAVRPVGVRAWSVRRPPAGTGYLDDRWTIRRPTRRSSRVITTGTKASRRLTAAVSEGRLSLEEFGDRVGLRPDGAGPRTTSPGSRETSRAHAPGVAVAAAATAPHGVLLTARPARAVRVQRSDVGSMHLRHGRARALRGAAVRQRERNWRSTTCSGRSLWSCPTGCQVDVSGGGPFASEVIDTPPHSSIPNAPRLRIRARGPGGTLYVRRPKTPPDR